MMSQVCVFSDARPAGIVSHADEGPALDDRVMEQPVLVQSLRCLRMNLRSG